MPGVQSRGGAYPKGGACQQQNSWQDPRQKRQFGFDGNHAISLHQRRKLICWYASGMTDRFGPPLYTSMVYPIE
jgi:hypothetical protein